MTPSFFIAIVFLSKEIVSTTLAWIIKGLLDLAQSGKFGTDLIWSAQFDTQIDRQMRLLTQFFWHCEGITIWDKEMRRPRIIHKTIHMFKAGIYEEWSKSAKAKNNKIKTRFAYAMESHIGWINAADLQIFNCFKSFDRLDLKGKNRIVAKINKRVVDIEEIVKLNIYLQDEDDNGNDDINENKPLNKVIKNPLNYDNL